MGSHWEETKKSIRDARYRLSVSTNSEILDTKHNARINEVTRGGARKKELRFLIFYRNLSTGLFQMKSILTPRPH